MDPSLPFFFLSALENVWVGCGDQEVPGLGLAWSCWLQEPEECNLSPP